MNDVRAARRLGIATCVAAFLTSALFVAPLLASQTDFGHVHPEDTTPHLHNLTAVLVVGSVPEVIAKVDPPSSLPTLLVSPAPTQPLALACPRCFASRAPPA